MSLWHWTYIQCFGHLQIGVVKDEILNIEDQKYLFNKVRLNHMGHKIDKQMEK
jgi:hypothetical protein